MVNAIKRFFGNFRLSTAIVTMVVVAILISVLTVSVAIYLNLSTTLRQQAEHQQRANLKTAATILAGSLPGSEVTWGEDGSLEAITAFSMPRQFLNHDLVDSIVRLTGESATVFGFDPAQQDFVRMTTTLVGDDGERIVGTSDGLALLYRVLERTDGDVSAKEALYLRICRLDPLQAIGFARA